MRTTCFLSFVAVAILLCCIPSGAAPQVEVKEHLGRPMIFIDGVPNALPTYSPIGFDPAWYKKQIPRFGPHKMGAYFVYPPSLFGTDVFWEGDLISNAPVAKDQAKAYTLIDEQAEMMQASDPGAYYIVRFGLYEPESWRKLHQDQMFVTETGETLPCPSMASDLYWDAVVRYCVSVIECYEHRPWADRIIGYANFHRHEGTYEAAISGWVFDHSPLMTARWRAFLQAKYGTDERLRAAYHDNTLTFATMQVPKDKLRQGTREVSRQLYWQAAKDNQPLRDYLELQRDLFHQRFRQISAAMHGAANRKVFFLHDALKQSMLGWDILDFFVPNHPKEFVEPELMSASGHMQVADLFTVPGCDGLITPHDYQARGVGGIFEPEGIVDSTVLRGKFFFCEMDTRTYTGIRKGQQEDYGMARDLREFSAVTWRNLATSFTRGFNPYYMDLCVDWFADAQMHPIIERQVQVIKESVNWPHQTVPGIAVILDDSAVLETNGAGNYMNEAVMWELKTSLARCGAPYRVYLLEDLQLPNFPKHRVFYFPNLFKVDDARLALLREKVFRDGNVVVWGPGSGISDGTTVGVEHATRLTGFAFTSWPANHAHRALVMNYTHPITRGLPADTLLGGALAYGPVLFPTTGTSLAGAWTKQGLNASGLAVLGMGKGARGAYTGKDPLGAGDYASVFAGAVPLPANLWRNLARYAGAHIYCNSNDILLADNTIVALHSVQSGEKVIALPGVFAVYDVITGKRVAQKATSIRFTLNAPDTRVFRLVPAGR
ncbi:MAG: hypothetical protein ACYDBB_22740 [Armatimonadota bacterium]